ncbi:hypothetical protein [uncultured Winogradskyella sp.]|uniref:hypothetical protein n=1 Tax=uncultured Winogradskyella sp. TaxID=395353 RepID=UPI0026078F5F|nr:hypothetical protein [uncultured Winogradskyella sp.]
MKPKLIHQQAMDFSFKAKQAAIENNHSSAFELFTKAANLESQVAEFYFDKPEHEPTRSVLIRSAAFLNLKAGLIDKAQEFIFFGLLNCKDELIKSQLNDALEIAISLKNMSQTVASSEYNYLSILRQKSIHYVLEPSIGSFGGSVSLDMIRDFSSNFLKSLKSYASSTFKRITSDLDYSEEAGKEFERLTNPLVTGSSYGSFKFSIANDFIGRPGEDEKIVALKSNIIKKYHENIFTNPLKDEDIKVLKEGYSKEEINQIFRPLTKIKSRNSHYKVGYYDTENFSKVFVPKIANDQKKKLLPIQELSKEDIGQLESSIIHTRELNSGRVSKKTIFREELKAYEFDQSIKEIHSKDYSPIILNEEIILNISFDSTNGFKLSFPDFDVEITDTEYQSGLNNLSDLLYKKIIYLVNKKEKNDSEEADFSFIKKLINDTDSLKK